MLKAKDKEKILKTAQEKWHIAYKGSTVRATADLPAETMARTTSQQKGSGMTCSKCWNEKIVSQ